MPSREEAHQTYALIRESELPGTAPAFVGDVLSGAVTPNGHKPHLDNYRKTVEEARRRNGTAPTDTSHVEWIDFDFDREDDAPRYLVDGLIEREFINLIASDTGVGKTWIGLALVVAALRGDQWLGRDVHARRVLVVDEENPARVIKSRLRALGLTNADREGLRYANRQGITIGSPQWNDWLRDQAREHRADLIIIDTATAATNIEDGNNNNEVTRLYTTLRAIARELDAAILILHHERKPGVDKPVEHGYGTMGARQWVGQADTHITLTRNGSESEDLGEGREALRTEAQLRQPKLRDGISNPRPELIAITSEKEDGRLLWAKVENLGVVDRATKEDEMLERIVGMLRERGDLRRGPLAAAVGVNSKEGTFDRALKKGLREDVGMLSQPKYGVYGLGPAAVAL